MPENVQEFLLETSILDRLCPPLGAALTRESDAQARLSSLVKQNLFTFPLDDEAYWYCY